ncbi:unnamed protein product [Phytomonas sp. Hart1]|nr:unnamed protein product [Phytomonas sp. Hart1]|eukprot:CCW67629.1 unnamed protein product [Phytomonas sp. isolate Hart1]
MASQMIALNPDKRDDIYYRYKMPAVITKVEGSGNGIKTVIPNIHDICLAMNRPEKVLMKFLQFELGAQLYVSEKDDKYLLMGSHSAERMQGQIDNFIRKLVLCKGCGNPETSVGLEGSHKDASDISMVCGACGKRSVMEPHRVLTVMKQHYKKFPELAKAAKGAAEARKKSDQNDAADGAADNANSMNNSNAAISSPLREKETRAFAKSELTDNRENVIDVLARVFKECGENRSLLIERVVRLMSEYNVSETHIPAFIILMMASYNSDNLLSTMKQYSFLLRRFNTVPELFSRQETHDEKELTELRKREARIQKTFLKQCQLTCAQNYNSDKLAVMIFLLYIEGILKDTSIMTWATKKESKQVVDPALDAEMKQKVMPILEWLGCN